MPGFAFVAALAQLGERQTEDLKVPGSIPGGGTLQNTSPMAQSVARQAVNLQVAGSNPAGGELLPVSAVVQWLGYLAFTQETRVQTPAAEVWPLSNLNSNPQKRRRQGSNLRMQSTLA